MGAHSVSLQPFLNTIFRHLSLYVKSDGTKFAGASDHWHDVNSAADHINKFILVLSEEKFSDELAKTLGFGLHEVQNVQRCTIAALSRITSQKDVESWITEILDVLVLFNSQQMINRKSSELELFSKSFQLEGNIESKRALGARSY